MTDAEHEKLMREVERLPYGAQIFVVPTEGLTRVMDPSVKGGTSASAAVPVEGKFVAHSNYWFRRFRDREVVLGTVPAAVVVKAEPAKSAKRAQDGDA